MSDFFISYTSADQQWAEWIGYVLEETGFSVVIQAWDFGPGSNFILEMQTAAATAPRTIMVLSPDYLKSQFAAPEWAAAFANDPRGLNRALVPVVVRKCRIEGLLTPLVHINLTGLDEDDARQRLVDGISGKRTKPSSRPDFPGTPGHGERKVFPGTTRTGNRPTPAPYLPKVRRPASDIEKRRFVKLAFDKVRAYFEEALSELNSQGGGIETDFQANTAMEIIAEIFVNGRSACCCRIWLGGMFSSDGISYAEGRHHFGTNSCNEVLSLSDEGDELALTSLMGAGFGGKAADAFDLKRLTPEHAAEYLWRRFVAPLER